MPPVQLDDTVRLGTSYFLFATTRIRFHVYLWSGCAALRRSTHDARVRGKTSCKNSRTNFEAEEVTEARDESSRQLRRDTPEVSA